MDPHVGDAQDELRRRMSPVIALTIDGPSDEALEREEFERAAAETIALWWKALSRLRKAARALAAAAPALALVDGLLPRVRAAARE